jgi:hypothetical protein
MDDQEYISGNKKAYGASYPEQKRVVRFYGCTGSLVHDNPADLPISIIASGLRDTAFVFPTREEIQLLLDIHAGQVVAASLPEEFLRDKEKELREKLTSRVGEEFSNFILININSNLNPLSGSLRPLERVGAQNGGIEWSLSYTAEHGWVVYVHGHSTSKDDNFLQQYSNRTYSV